MRRGLRAAGWVLAGLLGLAVLTTLATNLFLRSGLLRRLVNADPEALHVDFAGAVSLAPGRVSIDTLTLRSRDPNVELEIALEGVTFRLSLGDLPGRRFHLTRLRVRRLGFRLRERLTVAEATRVRLARYPRIEGFADVPLRSTGPSAPAPTKRPWRVVIDDLVVASVEEIWIDAWRWTGKGTVAGAFELLPGREARVGPARLEVASGDLRHGTSKVAERTVGSVWFEAPRFDVPTYPGNEIWKIVSGGSELRADLAGLAFFSSDADGPRISGGVGSIRERVDLRSGAGAVSLAVTAKDATVRVAQRTYHGSVEVDLRATEVDFRRGEASFTGTSVALSDVAVEGAPARPWAATFSAPTARLLFADGALDARLVGSLSDARPIVALMPSGLAKWVVGLLHLEDLHVTGSLAAAPSRFDLTSVKLTAGTFSVQGDYRSRPGSRLGKFRAKKGLLSYRFTIPSGG